MTNNTDFVLQYLNQKYDYDFEILDVHHLYSEGNPDPNAPYEIKVKCTEFPDRTFYIFAKLHDKEEILEDHFPMVLISEYLELKLSLDKKIIPATYALSFKLNSSAIEDFEGVTTLEAAGDYFLVPKEDSWYFYLSVVDNNYDESRAAQYVTQVIEKIALQDISNYYFEVNFYDEKDSKFSFIDIVYNPYGQLGENYQNKERIHHKWIGQFKREEVVNTKGDLTKNMRKIKNFEYKK